jgi:hypothetical protein
MEAEDVVHVLRRFRESLVPRGLILDLQVIRPHPVVESDGVALCEIDGSPLFETADSAAAAVDDMVDAGLLVDEAFDDHDVLKHYATGVLLVEDFAGKERSIPAEAIPMLEGIDRPVTVRERCRTRLLSRGHARPYNVLNCSNGWRQAAQ